MTRDLVFLGKTDFRNRETPFGIKRDDRRRHVYIVGKTGMGKSTMMENMVIQDVYNGEGVCFIDPHGDIIKKILDHIPSNRINDVVYINPADVEFPLAFNIMENVDPQYKHLVASGLMGVFTKIWAGVWSARMEYILGNCILALLDTPGTTMLGIARILVDKEYRKKIVDNIKDPIVKSFWVNEYANFQDKYRQEAIAPIQNKVGQFLSNSVVRNIVGQSRSTINLREIMDEGKILLVNLSKGEVGEENSALLGAMLITRLQLAAMSRVDITEEERKDFYLYVDEFQNFATEAFATILSEARKYRLNLTIAHQYIGQLVTDTSTKVRDAVFGNVGTMVVFRVGSGDAEFFETEFEPVFTPNDLINLPKYHTYLKLMIDGITSNPFSAMTLPPVYKPTTNMQKVIAVSREHYGKKRLEVEEKIEKWLGFEFFKKSALAESKSEIPDEDLHYKQPAKIESNISPKSQFQSPKNPAPAKKPENKVWEKVLDDKKDSGTDEQITKVLENLNKPPKPPEPQKIEQKQPVSAIEQANTPSREHLKPNQKIKF